MKRKKWTEPEEQTLLTHYATLLTTNTLSKLKTREKKFKPIADHINTHHHSVDPITYPFKWTWRDVSVKVQNMRNQYVGVKMKVKGMGGVGEVDWDDGLCHWGNFVRYRDVFGDVEIEELGEKGVNIGVLGNGVDGLGLGFGDEGEEEGEEEEGEGEDGESGSVRGEKMKRGKLGFMGGKGLELRENGKSDLVKGDRMKRGRLGFVGGEDENGESGSVWGNRMRRGRLGFISGVGLELGEKDRGERREGEEGAEGKLIGVEELRVKWAKRELARRVQEGREMEEELRRRMRNEERREEEEMEWRERLVAMQIEHEKQMMQMHANACQNQMQVLGVVVRPLCQFLGSGGDGLDAGLGAGALTPRCCRVCSTQEGWEIDSGGAMAYSHSNITAILKGTSVDGSRMNFSHATKQCRDMKMENKTRVVYNKR